MEKKKECVGFTAGGCSISPVVSSLDTIMEMNGMSLITYSATDPPLKNTPLETLLITDWQLSGTILSIEHCPVFDYWTAN